MKTIYDSNPEFSLTYTHIGISVTISETVLTQAYLSIASSDQDNEELLGEVAQDALPKATSQVAQLLTQFHSEFYESLAVSHSKQVLSRTSSYMSDIEENIITKTKDKS